MEEDILLLHKGQFHVHLGEFRLAVGPQILVPVAAGHLVIFVHPAHHQELLENLWGLGQGVKAARVDPAGDQVIPRPLRGALGEGGGFHLEEALPVQIPPGGAGQQVAEAQGAEHRGAAEVKIAVFQPQFLPHRGEVVHREGEGLRLAEHLQRVGPQFDGAGLQAGVIGFLIPDGQGAADGNHRFVFQRFRRMERFPAQVQPVEYHLQRPLSVPEVEEDDAAHIPPGLHPAHRRDAFSHILFAELSAVAVPFHNRSPSMRFAGTTTLLCKTKSAFRPSQRDEKRRCFPWCHPIWPTGPLSAHAQATQMPTGGNVPESGRAY